MRSLVKKLSLLTSFICLNNFDIYCFTETWLTVSVYDNELFPCGYSVYRRDRSSRGGGVLLAINDRLPSTRLPSPDAIEAVAVSVGLDVLTTLCAVYVPPNSTPEYVSSLCSYMYSLSLSSAALILVGDFNFPDIVWGSLGATCSVSLDFCESVFQCNLTQLVDVPTHVKGNVLDLVLTSNEDFVTDLVIHSGPDLPFQSDHFMVSFNLACNKAGTITVCDTRLVPDYSKADWEAIDNYILDSDFSLCFESNDVDEIWSVIKQVISTALHLFVPNVRLRKSQFPKWFTPSLRHQHKCLRSLERRCGNNCAKLSKAEDDFRRSAEAAKAAFESQLIVELGSSKSGKIFQYLRSLKKSGDFPSTVHHGSCRASTDEGKASLFNTYFHSVFSDSPLPLPSLDCSDFSSSLNVTFTESDVFNALQSLDTAKAMGMDGIGPNVLKHCALGLCEPLHRLFTTSIRHHSIPAEWKIHRITPIFKSGDRDHAANWRPISLLSCTSKVLEKLVYDRLFAHLEQQISISQFGFQKKRSTQQQLLLFYNHILERKSASSQWDLIYLDFAKAFDSISHCELLVKLRSLGVHGDLWLWLREYLTCRQQFVQINNSRSEILPVRSGVPQGSVLGPLLFIAFINDLPDVVTHSRIGIFADDTKCAKEVKCVQDCKNLQEDLFSASSWSREWKMKFKVPKCVHLRCCSGGPVVDSSYVLIDCEVTRKDHHKDLGIIFSADFTFTAHYDMLINRAYSTLGLLRRTFSSRTDVAAKKFLYTTLIRSQLVYCSTVWRPSLLKDIVVLERVQRRATK